MAIFGKILAQGTFSIGFYDLGLAAPNILHQVANTFNAMENLCLGLKRSCENKVHACCIIQEVGTIPLPIIGIDIVDNVHMDAVTRPNRGFGFAAGDLLLCLTELADRAFCGRGFVASKLDPINHLLYA